MAIASPLRTAARPWVKRVVAVLVYLALAEVALRGAVWLRVRLGDPPHCGLQPELLHRVLVAYGGREIDPVTMRADPRRGYRHAPNVRNREDSGAPFSTNRRGARGQREYAVPKPAATVRIVALGDSFTFGQGMPDEATWPAQLEERLPNTEVVNLGERGYGHDQMYYALQDDGVPLQPDAVILAFYNADTVRDALTFFCFEKPRFSRSAEGWQVENVPVPSYEEMRRRYLLLPMLYIVPRVLFEVAREPSIILGENRGDSERATEIIRRMRALTEASGARFLMVNLPEHPEAAPATQGFFHDFCSETATECIDPWPDFSAAAGTSDPDALRARYVLPHDIHYSRAGYAVIADAVRRHLTAHPIRPAPPVAGARAGA